MSRIRIRKGKKPCRWIYGNAIRGKGLKMELKQLQYFAASVECGSFKRAAEKLYTTQPNVSKTIKALENELQVRLLDRRAHGVVLTRAGEEVYRYTCAMMPYMDKIRAVAETAEKEAVL